MINDPGTPIGDKTTTNYTKENWGNPFFFSYLLQEEPSYIIINKSTTDAIQLINTNKEQELDKITGLARKFDPYVIPVRYNPNKDKGIGNIAYFLRTDSAAKKDWEPPSDDELIIKNFPLWLMLWGFEDYILKHNKINNLDQNGILVIRSDYISEKQTSYVFLSDSFVNGQGPYGVDRDQISLFERGHWYPKWEFQKEAIEEILMTGPGVCRPQNNESIQSHLKYQFFLSGEATHQPWKQYTTPTASQLDPIPVTNSSKMKLLVQQQALKTSSTTGKLDATHLHKQLQKELLKSQLMNNMCSQMEQQLQQTSRHSKNNDTRNTDNGRRRSTTIPAAPAPRTTQPATPAAIQTTENISTKFYIKGCVKHVKLFEPYQKNRRFTAREFEQELEISKIFQRPPRSFIHDKPFYPWVPLTPLVNFDLNYK